MKYNSLHASNMCAGFVSLILKKMLYRKYKRHILPYGSQINIIRRVSFIFILSIPIYNLRIDKNQQQFTCVCALLKSIRHSRFSLEYLNGQIVSSIESRNYLYFSFFLCRHITSLNGKVIPARLGSHWPTWTSARKLWTTSSKTKHMSASVSLIYLFIYSFVPFIHLFHLFICSIYLFLYSRRSR